MKRKRECHIGKKKFVEGNYFRISNFVFDFKLRPITFMVYCYLEKCDNPERGCFPSKATIAEECGIAESSVDKAIKELKKCGIVRVQHRRTKNQQQSNMYHLNNLYALRFYEVANEVEEERYEAELAAEKWAEEIAKDLPF